MASLSIRNIINQVSEGQIRVPSFQRGFVWDPTRVAFLMDSIYKGFPIGSLLVWRTREKLEHDRKIGPFVLPQPKADFPIDYVLDGQQRITSLFGVFQTDIEQEEDPDWMNIYFNLSSTDDAQESRFLALDPEEVDNTKHFPIKSLFDTVGYRIATKELDDSLANQVDILQTRFKEAQIPIQMLSTDDKTTVAIVFERVNQRGVPLDTLQLLTAWTWSQDFLLQREFEELTEELEPFGFNSVGEDQNLLLRCCSAVLANNVSIDTLMTLNGSEVRNKFSFVTNGLKGAIDFLRKNLNIYSLNNLPYVYLIVPLSVFFASEDGKQVRMTHEQKRVIIKWFWKVCFSKRYNSQPIKSVQNDIELIKKLKEGISSELGKFPMNSVSPEIFKAETFRVNNVITKTFILMLAQFAPESFISGSKISLDRVLKDYNKNEFHHLFPKSYIKQQSNIIYDVNVLANYCFLTRVDNNSLGGSAPSIYRKKMPNDVKEILEHSLCPSSLFNDNFNLFISERAKILAEKANELIG